MYEFDVHTYQYLAFKKQGQKNIKKNISLTESLHILYYNSDSLSIKTFQTA